MSVFERATPDDLPALRACLEPVAEKAMFPLANLANHGLDGDDPRAPRMWVLRKGGQVTDVLSVTKAGMLMPYLPSEDYGAAAAALPDLPFVGIVGPAEYAAGLKSALGLQFAETILDDDETHFLLDLENLICPEGPGEIEIAAARHRGTLIAWMCDYQRNILNTPENQVLDLATSGVDHHIATGQRVVLMEGDDMRATTAFNAALPDIVQIGGVYTPPENRGKGLARRAVGLQLKMARDGGAKKATLFAVDPSAIAAYEAVGFRPIGRWTLCLFAKPERQRPVDAP